MVKNSYKMKRFIDCYIPTETCNFKCHYCYIAQNNLFTKKILQLPHDPKFIANSLSKKRLGGTCMFNLCAGGETLISHDVVLLIKSLLEEGHFVMVVTNGSLTNRFEEISQFDSVLLERLFFKFSFHYLELKRLGLLDRYFNNIRLVSEKGASFTVEITPNDELEPYIDEIKELSLKELGALPHITIGRKDSDDIPILTKHTKEEYYKIWESFDSTMLTFKKSIFGVKRTEFCYAGEWSFYLNIMTGNITQCYCGGRIGNIYKNIDKKINFLPIGNNCSQPHCYNGHAFLTFGDIPELISPTYDKLRNRVTNTGTEWLKPKMKDFMMSKLVDSNREYTLKEKKKTNKKNRSLIFKTKLKKIVRKIIK